MKKRIIALSILFVLLLSFTASASNGWYTSVSKDEMEGTKTWYAFSPNVKPTEQMGFPYGNIKAWIGIGYDGESEWVYVGFNKSPNLSDSETKDGYDLIYTRIKWDDKVKNVTLTQDWGAKFIHFRNARAIVSKIANSNTVLLELDWYGEGKVYFRFPLGGSAAAIDKIHNAFKD